MVISKPCDHPDCPQREGFIRGQYESIEFIRKVPQKPRKASSYGDLRKFRDQPLDKQAMLRRAENVSDPSESRPRGKTVSFAGTREARAKAETHDLDVPDEELNPVEWIMITRSDPGGSVPRFMVERGTPGGIVADAGKFLDWACRDTILMAISNEEDEEAEENEENAAMATIEPPERKADLVANQFDGPAIDGDSLSSPPQIREYQPQTPDVLDEQQRPPSMLASMTSAALNSLSPYTPQAVLDRVSTPTLNLQRSAETSPSSSRHSSIASVNSFASAKSGLPITPAQSLQQPDSSMPIPTQTRPASSSDPTANTMGDSKLRPPSSNYEKQIQKLDARKSSSEIKLAQTRKALLDSQGSRSRSSSLQSGQSSSRESKLPDKQAKEIAQAEARHAKEMASIEEKRAKEAKKEADRQAKELDRQMREEEKRKANEAKEEEKRRRNEQKEEARRRKEEFVEERQSLEKENGELRERVAVLEREAKAMKGVLEEATRENLELKIRVGVRALEEGLQEGDGEEAGEAVVDGNGTVREDLGVRRLQRSG